MKTCESCIYYDELDDFKFYCEVHGICIKDDFTPCRRYIPIEGTEEEDND